MVIFWGTKLEKSGFVDWEIGADFLVSDQYDVKFVLFMSNWKCWVEYSTFYG